jgi:GH24 family phage-related lysozyme (muramidase)
MKINNAGLALIKSFESCKLTAYKAVSTEKYYTIGWGHYGADVKKGMKITQAQADAYLVSDLAKFEAKVEKYQSKYNFNENQFSALVSFAYNIGSIDQLTANGTRTIAQISAKIPAYNKSGGKVLAGLTKRRNAEKTLFNTAVATTTSTTSKVSYYPKYTGSGTSLVSALASVGEKDTTFAHRKKIAIANGTTNYIGGADQNIKLVNLLKAGKCIKA